MSTISEVFLPGVQRKFQVETITGDRLVIVIHDDGTRELYHFTRGDMNRAASVLRLSDGEARQIAGLTTVSSSAIVAKILFDYQRMANPERRSSSASLCSRTSFLQFIFRLSPASY